jgi:hypothetical protein
MRRYIALLDIGANDRFGFSLALDDAGPPARHCSRTRVSVTFRRARDHVHELRLVASQ